MTDSSWSTFKRRAGRFTRRGLFEASARWGLAPGAVTDGDMPATDAVEPPPDREPGPAPAAAEPPLLCWPLDHFYSPVPDHRALMREPAHSRVFPSAPPATPGIDWRADQQLALLQTLGTEAPIDFPDEPTGDPRDYHAGNEMFSRLDAWVLQAMLRHFRPSRVIEVGCGWSSLVTARINREYLNGIARVTCIEPYPPPFLDTGVDGISEVIATPVQETPVQRFQELAAGDVLFIDTAHVAKTGGDVVFLYQEVLPRLASGVVVHIHDIFLPWDYPEEWVRSGRAWNEQYLVRAFLTFNDAYDIELSVHWMLTHHRDALAAAIDGYPAGFEEGGGSLWLRRR